MLCPESRKTSRDSPTAQGKNWLWKRKLTRCAGSPTTPERKNALPVLHGRSEGDFPRFRVTPQAGRTPMPGGILQKKYSIPRETPPKQEVRQAVSSGRKFPPSGKPPGQDRRKGNSPEKYGRRKESSHEWPVHSPFPFAAGTFQAERNVRNRCLPEKGSPRRKACCGTCRCAGGSRERKSPPRIPSAGSARKTRELRKEQRNTGGGNLSLPGA